MTTGSKPLSKAAQALYERVQNQRWYPAYGKRVPKAMKELEDAGLVQIAGRAQVITACFVPKGFKVREEVYPAKKIT